MRPRRWHCRLRKPGIMPPPSRTQHSHRLWVFAGLALLTLIAYWPVRHFGFVNYDDYQYVCKNPHIASGLTRSNIAWAFTTFDTNNYFPITWLSFLLDANLFGARPQGLHVENALLHALNSILLCQLLLEATAEFWPAVIVAAVFAVHPTHVESVAWITERKDVLYMLFFLLAMLSYVRYAASRHWRGCIAYLAAIFFLACGLLSKSMLVTFPFVLLLVDVWPLYRLGAVQPGRFPRVTLLRALIEKIPFLAISLAATAVGYRAQAEITSSLHSVPLGLRVQNAALSYAEYLAESVWPVDLSVLHPYRWKISSASVIGDCLLLIAISVFVFVRKRDRRIRTIGWLWFLGTMVPAIGIVQVGPQSMGDRFLYLPSIGLSILIVSLLRPFATRLGRNLTTAATIAILVVLTVLTRRQVGYLADTDSLFHHA